MTTNDGLERRVASHYASEPPLRAPDRVLLAALATIDTTPQRRGFLAPWRYAHMTPYPKIAAAGVVAIAIGAIALATVRPDPPPGIGTPTPSPMVTQQATAAPTTEPTLRPGEPVPPVTETFRSEIHGVTSPYPEGWQPRAAVDPWPAAGGLPLFGSTFTDAVYDPALTDHLFLGFASQPLGEDTGQAWIDRTAAVADCAASDPIVIDGANGQLADCSGALMAFVADGRRGYLLVLFRSGDYPWLAELYDREVFTGILAGVRLRPGAAVDEP